MIAYMIIGGQWGSEGKGLFAGYMAIQREPDAVVCQFGPNAGHTWYEGDRPIVFKSLPVASVMPSVKRIFLGPGSVINPEILEKELRELGPLLDNKEIFVHEAAAILGPWDAAAEAAEGGVSHIASTRQGTMEAMIRKLRRQGAYPAEQALKHLQVHVIKHKLYRTIIEETNTLQMEGSQGMDLSINCGHEYPYTTSRDCTPAQVLADCGVNPRDLGAVYACIRTYPIRVGNIVGGDGVVIGNSGPCYTDQVEMTWEQIGQPQELTTVTKRVRRVFSFSLLQIEKLLEEVRPTGLFLNFANYLLPESVVNMRNKIDSLGNRMMVRWTGHGPKHTDIKEHNPHRSQPPRYQE